MKRIRSLDGIRAVAIILVLISHVSGGIHSPITHNKFFVILGNGNLGVNIFFAISGYLITKLLLFERQKTGRISLKDFYVRRVLRIFPVFYLYILVVILLKVFFIPRLFENYTMIVVAALYLWNYAHLFNLHINATNRNDLQLFGHFWSLSLEEQFYLIWPITLIKLNSFTLKKTLVIILLIMPVIRVATYFFMPGSRGQINMMLQTGSSSIFMGCLGALIENTDFFNKKIVGIINNTKLIWGLAIFLFILSPLLSLYFKGSYYVTIGNALETVCIIILLFWCVYVPSKVAWFLNSKIMVEIGILSYSLYIWQQLFLRGHVKLWFNRFPQNIFLVFIVAAISYYLVEKPILKLKKKFVKI